MVARGEFASAIAEIHEATNVEAGSQILVNENANVWQEYRDSQSVIVDLLGSLPTDFLNRYRRQAEPLARNQYLKAVRDSDFQTLRILPSRFPLTTAAHDALSLLVSWHLDRHEFAAADSVARRLIQQSGLSTAQRTTALRTIELHTVLPTKQNSNSAVRDAPTVNVPAPKASGPNTAEPRRSALALRAKLFPSLTRPDWQVSSGLDDESTTLARHALHEHFEQSIPILPQARPLIVDGVVVRRSLTEVSGHDLESGQLLWSDESESEAGQSASRLAMNLSLQELMAQKLARGLQIDSLQSRLSSDGDRVFTVESGAGVMVGRSRSRTGLLVGSNHQSQNQNRIVARQLRTGNVTWNLTADSILAAIPPGEQTGSARDNVPLTENAETQKPSHATAQKFEDGADSIDASEVNFCGLPMQVDRHVLGLVQVAGSLRLYAADRNTGRIDWSLGIAEIARLSPSDADWRSIDCRVTLIDGVLVCPTGAGLLIGVDLGTRSVIWSRRYSRADVPLEVTRLPFVPARPQRPWWLGWRDNRFLRVTRSGSAPPVDKDATQITESVLIVAGPDAQGVKAIDPRTGQLLWHHRVDSPVDLISHDDRIILVSRHFVSALNSQSGDVIWKIPCREPVGTGYTTRAAADSGDNHAAAHYVFPVRGGSLVAVNCETGAMMESVDHLESLSGCLISTGDLVISMNPDLLSVWPILSSIPDRRSPAEEATKVGTSVGDSSQVNAQAAFERSCGLFSEAATRLREQTDSLPAKDELRKTLLAWLESGTLSSPQIAHVALEAEQLAGELAIADQIVIRHAAARAATMAGDPVVALNFYAQLQSLNPSGEPRFLKPEPLRSVRHDRLIQGEVINLLSHRDEQVVARLTQAFAKLGEIASASRDPFALQRFTRQWQLLPMATRYAVDDRSRIGLRYELKQLALLALAESDDRNLLADASSRLIGLYESRSYARDAAAIRRRLQQDNFTWKAVVDESRPVDSPWNTGAVTVSEHSEQNLDTTFIPVPVTCSTGALFDRLNVAINPRSSRNDTILRFYGDGFSGSWQTVIPTSASPLKSVSRLYRGWGLGHFLVLQLGAELFGISPFDSSGEPRVQRLWSVDMAADNRQEDHEYAPAIPGFAEEELTMLDAFDRPITKVGPVRAGYLCYQTRGKLVCLDTSTGQRLWQRYEFPRQSICSGDGQHVYVVQPGEDQVTVLRVVDGAEVSEFPLSDAAGFRDIVLSVSGDRILMAQRSPDAPQNSEVLSISRMASVSLRAEKMEWSTDVDPAATVFAIGSEWLGIVEMNGQLKIVDCHSGQAVSTFTVQRPDQIRSVHVTSDALSHVIAFSDTSESAFLNGRSAGGARNPAVTGQLVAIDALTAKLKWQRTVNGIRFQLDQPKNAPCIVLSYQRARGSDMESTESVLHVINRESGEDILNRRGASSPSDFTFEPHADQHRLSIRMARKSIRLTFAPRTDP